MTRMANLTSITIENFRSVRGTISIPIDASVILIHGTNGTGKTTVMAALELALTGRVTAVDDSEIRHLIHRGASSATVSLTSDADSRTLTVADSGISGSPLLDQAAAHFFIERANLQQRSLGRLLELYDAHADGEQSRLERFVHDLLGIESVDALIDGLHIAGNKRRVNRDVDDYRQVKQDLATANEALSSSISGLTELTTRQTRRQSELTRALAALDAPADLVTSLEACSNWLSAADDAGSAEIAEMIAVRRDLASLRARLVATNPRAGGDRLQQLEDAAEVAREAATSWQTDAGQRLETLLDEARELLPAVGSARTSTDPQRIADQTRALLLAERDSLLRGLEDSRAAQKAADAGQVGIEAARKRLNSMDQELLESEPRETTEALAQALAAILPHIHSEDCPVCGRDFAEIDQGPLSTHLASAISRLSAHAGRLEDLSRSRLNALREIRRLEADLQSLAGRLLDAVAASEAYERATAIDMLLTHLEELLPVLTPAAEIIRARTETERDLNAALEADRTDAQLRNELARVRRNLALSDLASPFRLPETLADTEQHVSASLQELEAAAEFRRAALTELDVLTQLTPTESRLRRVVEVNTERRDALRAALAEADQRIVTLRNVRNEAMSIRQDMIREVFTESLNRVWRDLFVRLAPEEPFVPNFRVPTDGTRVTTELETVHRDGTSAGAPTAMLSAGNLNTAALTLFLALNLSVEPQVPWMILDDPVQSMDEVHISQFAALLRALTRDHGRRVLIAVHERALFEYLSLELSAATPSDSLITVELDRDFAGATVASPTRHPFEPDFALADELPHS